MVTLNFITLLISIGVLYSLRWMQNIFLSIEKITYYMVIVVAIEQIHSAILDNYKLLEFSEALSAFFFYKMNQLIIFPIATMWLLFSFFHSKPRLLLKMLILGIWFACLIESYMLFEILGIVKFTGWNFGYAIVVWYIVLVESLCFSLLFRKMLGKCDHHDIVSP
ncbi:hypothetical protein ASG89_27760 [Paenibacillus sp. Soil766]|uniref:hypothetical protein n=1 Tax=Paenibacillus sp. Soil766 TaxID=1736404 RepID=UPI00070AEB30|nr:hypothetical protein [Paenibacillus sp. Soil766]KRE99360.1 hypothetical protein ASG89_27760 [Paenibacillus sp. Soil766]